MLCFHAFYDILIFKSEFRLMVSSIWSYKRNSNVGISFTAVGKPAFSRVKDNFSYFPQMKPISYVNNDKLSMLLILPEVYVISNKGLIVMYS